MAGITLERLKREGWARLSVPDPFVPFADGFPSASGRLEFVSPRMAEAGLDPVPTYTPPYEAAQRDTELAARYPLALIAPASHYFLNSMFSNVPGLEKRQGPPTVVLHPDDAAARGLCAGDLARIYNDAASSSPTAPCATACARFTAAAKGLAHARSPRTTINATVRRGPSDMAAAPSSTQPRRGHARLARAVSRRSPRRWGVH